MEIRVQVFTMTEYFSVNSVTLSLVTAACPIKRPPNKVIPELEVLHANDSLQYQSGGFRLSHKMRNSGDATFA